MGARLDRLDRQLLACLQVDNLQTAERLAEQVARLRGGGAPARVPLTAATSNRDALHRRAHAVAGRALLVAASRADTAAAILAAERMDAHAAALEPRALATH